MENKGKGIFYGVIAVATLIVAIIGATFAYFTASGGTNNSISGTTAAASSVTLAVEKVAPTTDSKLIPLASSSDMATALSKSCKDDNGYDACQVYSITISNAGADAIYAATSLQLTVGTVANAKWQLLTGSSKDDWALDSSFTAVDTHTSASSIATSESLDASTGSKTYYVVIWVENNGDQTSTDAGQSITGSVTTSIVNSSGTSIGNLKATFSSSK